MYMVMMSMKAYDKILKSITVMSFSCVMLIGVKGHLVDNYYLSLKIILSTIGYLAGKLVILRINKEVPTKNMNSMTRGFLVQMSKGVGRALFVIYFNF